MSEIVEAVAGRELDQVRSLFREYQAQLVPRYRARSLEAELAKLPGAYSPPEGTLLLATVSGQPVGCVGLRPFPLEGACEMKHLYVRPTFRDGRIGKELLQRVIQDACALGYSRLRLDTHPPTMQPAFRIYCKLGFREVDPGPIEAIEGLVYMELALPIARAPKSQ